MKKLVVFLLLLSIFLGLAACGGEGSGDNSSGEVSSGDTALSNAAVTEVTLSKTSLQLKVGGTAGLTASVFYMNENGVLTSAAVPENDGGRTVLWESSDPSVVEVKDGTLTACAEGSAVVTVTTKNGGKTASCTVKVISAVDLMDQVDLSEAEELWDLGGYHGGLRLKSTGEILFSPNLSELREIINDNSEYEDYQGYIRFTYVPDSLDEEEGAEEYTFPSVLLPTVKSKGAWVDFYLQGEDMDCGFCPTAGTFYTVELTIVRTDAPEKGIFTGSYFMYANDDIENSPYYEPTEMGPGREEGQFYIRYGVQGRGGHIQGAAKQLLDKGQGSSEVVAVPEEGFAFLQWSDGVKTAARSGDTATEDLRIYAYFTVSVEDSGVPSISIITDSGLPVTSKEYETAMVSISGAAGEEYNITAPAQIRGRGNSSWNGGAPQYSYDSKNSYRLKFDEKVQLLGVGDSENRDWVLQSNKFDLSGLRNWLVWDLADRMGTMPYVPECTWVQLYVNGEYRGMYMVCELIEVAKDRIEVDDKIDSTDKGYLLEFDFRGNYDDDPYFYIDGYGPAPRRDLHGAVEIVIKSKISGDDDLKFIEDYILRCHNAIMDGDRAAMDSLMDIPSLIDMFIIEELSKDCDVGRASFFVQKNPGGKLYFTAPWDFDFGFGTYGPAQSAYGLVSGTKDGCAWYGALIEQQWFKEAVIERMNELSGDFKETLEAVRSKGAELKAAADVNALFWDMYGNGFHQYVSSQVSSSLYSYEEHIDFLVDWSEERWQSMLEDLSE